MKKPSLKIIVAICVAFLCFVACKKEDKKTPEEPAAPTPTPATPSATYATVNDGEGTSYKTVVIGTQTWTAENLRSTKYNDGIPIQYVTNQTTWNSFGDALHPNYQVGAYCYYSYADSNKTKYGCYYNWYTVNTGKLAPAGWHVADSSDYATLYNYCNPKYGAKLFANLSDKSWSNSTNESGFSALPAGYLFTSGFSPLNSSAYFWTSRQVGSQSPNAAQVATWSATGVSQLPNTTLLKLAGIPVRLVKN